MRIVQRSVVRAAIFGAFLSLGCVPRGAHPVVSLPPDQLHWVEGPTPEVRTLLLEPVRVARVGAPGQATAGLHIGAFFSRFDRDRGPLDQLALMVEVRGTDATALLALSRELLLEIDGELFAGEPTSGANSILVEPVPGGGQRAVLVIPVTPADLELLARAVQVRGRLGLWASFSFPPEVRARFEALLTRLPPGAPIMPAAGIHFYRAAELD